MLCLLSAPRRCLGLGGHECGAEGVEGAQAVGPVAQAQGVGAYEVVDWRHLMRFALEVEAGRVVGLVVVPAQYAADQDLGAEHLAADVQAVGHDDGSSRLRRWFGAVPSLRLSLLCLSFFEFLDISFRAIKQADANFPLSNKLN